MNEFHKHRSDCKFAFAPLDVCDCIEQNMADRIEELVATNEKLEAKLARAVTGSREIASGPDFGQTLTSEAEMLTAPRHFGKSLDMATTGDDSEILPTSKPKLRRRPAKEMQRHAKVGGPTDV